MNKTTRILLGALTAAALVAPSVGLSGTAQAAPTSEVGHSQQAAKPKKAKAKLKISAVKGFVHYGLTTDEVKVKAKGAKRGKVKFSIDGADAGTVKLKKGKASLAIPASLPVGEHVVKAKMKKAKPAKIKITSYNTTMTLSATAVTVTKSTFNAPSVSGQVVYKGTVADKGFVDAYNDDGNITIGADSPDLLGVASVEPNGAFKFSTVDYLDYAPGTYTMRLFFEYDAGYDDYLFGAPVTVTVVP